jgi:hypothetical protein
MEDKIKLEDGLISIVLTKSQLEQQLKEHSLYPLTWCQIMSLANKTLSPYDVIQLKQEQPQKIELTSLQIMDLYNQKIAPHEVLPKQEQSQPECTCHVFYNPFKRTLLDKSCPIHGSPKDKSEETKLQSPCPICGAEIVNPCVHQIRDYMKTAKPKTMSEEERILYGKGLEPVEWFCKCKSKHRALSPWINKYICTLCGNIIKDEEPAKPDHDKKVERLVHETRWDMDKQIVKKINELVDKFNSLSEQVGK